MKVVLGIGNELREDDSLGVKIARELENRFKDMNNVKLIECGSAPVSFIGKIPEEPEELYIVDALKVPCLSPGEILFKELDELKETEKPISTHRLPISIIQKKINPDKTYLVGAKPIKMGYGGGLSSEIKDAKEKLKKKLLKEIK